MDTILSIVVRDLPFGRNQPLKYTENYYTDIYANKKRGNSYVT